MFVVVACSLWLCSPFILLSLDDVLECGREAKKRDVILIHYVNERAGVRVVCMSKEQYAKSAKTPRYAK